MHVVDNAGIDVIKHDFAVLQEFRHDAQNLATSLLYRAGGFPHEANTAAAIDKPQTGTSQYLTQIAGRLPVSGVFAESRTTVNTDGADIMLGEGHGVFNLSWKRRLVLSSL